MTDEERAEDNITDSKHSTGSPADATLQPLSFRSAAAMQQSFAAADTAFTALTRFGYEVAQTVPIEDRVRAMAQIRKQQESAFIRNGIIEIDSSGSYRDIQEYWRAVEAIRAKAVALGYGAQSQTIPIVSVPGGYVGRFEGNDIYATGR